MSASLDSQSTQRLTKRRRAALEHVSIMANDLLWSAALIGSLGLPKEDLYPALKGLEAAILQLEATGWKIPDAPA